MIRKQRNEGDTFDLQALFSQIFGDVRSVIRVRFVLTRAIAFDLAAKRGCLNVIGVRFSRRVPCR